MSVLAVWIGFAGALAWLSIDQIFDALRDDRRFDQLLERMNLPRLEQVS